MKYLFLPLTILSILLMKSYSKDSFYYENENNISIDKLAHITEILTPVRTSDNKIYEDVNKPTILALNQACVQKAAVLRVKL